MTWRCTSHQHGHFHVVMAVQIDAERSFACFDRTGTHPIRGERAGRAAAHEQLPDATSGGQLRRTKASATAKDTPKQATQTHKHTHTSQPSHTNGFPRTPGQGAQGASQPPRARDNSSKSVQSDPPASLGTHKRTDRPQNIQRNLQGIVNKVGAFFLEI